MNIGSTGQEWDAGERKRLRRLANRLFSHVLTYTHRCESPRVFILVLDDRSLAADQKRETVPQPKGGLHGRGALHQD